MTDIVVPPINPFRPEANPPHVPTAERALALPLFALSLLLGFAGFYLIFPERLGLGASLWALLVLALLGWHHQRQVPGAPMRLAALYALAAAAALCLAWRDAPLLKVGSIVLYCFSVAWIHLSHAGIVLRKRYLTEFICDTLGLACTWLILPVSRCRVLRDVGPSIPAETLKPILRGSAIALAVLLLFGTLLAKADLRFGELFQFKLPLDWSDWLTHGLWILLFSAIAISLTALDGRKGGSAPSRNPVDDEPKLGALEAIIPMAALDLLFAVFVYMQLGYLFGGEAYVQETMGVTYAQYARHGFFELAAVAGLVLAMQLFFDWLLRGESATGRKRFHNLALIQVLLLLGILASAAHRMALYQEAYGLTQLRVYASAGIFWIGLTVLWHGATVLRNRREFFVIGTVIAAIAVFFLLQAANPDSMIARVNLERMAGQPQENDSEIQGRRQRLLSNADLELLRDLSADAVPAIFASKAVEMGMVSPAQATQFLTNGKDENLLRTWSWGLWRARQAVN